MSSSPISVKNCRDDKVDRVQRACDRCNNSRTRCSGELPCRRCYKLNYPCQYERTVKKRARANTCTSPTSTISSDLSYQENGVAQCATQWGHDAGSTSPASSDGHSTFGSLNMRFSSDMGIIRFPEALTPSSSQFPFTLWPITAQECGHGKDSDFEACRCPCLNPILPLLKGIMTPEAACNLLEVFFADPETVVPSQRSPYVLSPVIRGSSVLRQTNPRPISPALLAIILWCVAQTENLDIFPDASTRARATQRLYFLSMKLLQAREYDSWSASGDSGSAGDELVLEAVSDCEPASLSFCRSKQAVDDVLSYVLLACVISGTESKGECFKWWNKAVLLVLRLGFNSEARIAEGTPSAQQMSLAAREAHEERRRAFWLVYALDRHLAFSFNQPLHIHDSECQVLCPLPGWVWQSLESVPLQDVPVRMCGPPTQIYGTGFFEYFLPLMTILGDIIELRSRNQHPRLGGSDEPLLVATIETMLSDCECSLNVLDAVSAPIQSIIPDDDLFILPISLSSFGDPASCSTKEHPENQRSKTIIAYSKYIIQVLHMLLRENWNAAPRVAGVGNCVPSPEATCTASSLTSGECITQILHVDSSLTFMPFLFGVYLFQGSLNFLSLVDEMSRAGADDLAKQGISAIVRAHEVAIKSLDTSFQRYFTRVIRQYTCVVGGLGNGRLPGDSCKTFAMRSELNNDLCF